MKFEIHKKLFLMVTVLISAVAAILRTVVIIFSIDGYDTINVGYTLKNNAAVTAFTVSAVIVCLAVVVFAFFVGKRIGPKLTYGTPSVTFTVSLLGSAMVVVSVYTFVCWLTRFYPLSVPDVIRNGIEGSYSLESLKPYTIIVIILAFLTGLAFLYAAYSKKLIAYKKFHPLLTTVPVIMLAARLLTDFIATSTMPLRSSGGYHLLGVCAMILFFLIEGKITVGIGNVKLYWITGALSVFLVSVYAIPAIYLCAFWTFDLSYTVVFSVLDITAMLYIITRMLTMKVIPDEE